MYLYDDDLGGRPASTTIASLAGGFGVLAMLSSVARTLSLTPEWWGGRYYFGVWFVGLLIGVAAAILLGWIASESFTACVRARGVSSAKSRRSPRRFAG